MGSVTPPDLPTSWGKSDLFAGVVAYVQQYDVPDQAQRSKDIMLLKDHGAVISASLSDRHTTHIICSHPSSTVRESSYIDWNVREPSVADLVSMQKLGGMPPGKLILRSEWIEDCLQRGAVLGPAVSWGGWIIRESASPVAGPRLQSQEWLFANRGPEPAKRSLPVKRPASSRKSASDRDQRAHRPNLTPRRQSASVGSHKRYFSSFQNTTLAAYERLDLDYFSQAAFDRYSSPNAQPGAASYASRPPSPPQTPMEDACSLLRTLQPPSILPVDLTLSFSLPEPPLPPQPSTPPATPLPTTQSGAAEKAQFVGQQSKIFETACGALEIYVDEELRMKPSLEMMVERVGGGKIVTDVLAAYHLLATPVNGHVSNQQQIQLDYLKAIAPYRMVLSYEWAIECLRSQSLLDTEGFRIGCVPPSTLAEVVDSTKARQVISFAANVAAGYVDKEDVELAKAVAASSDGESDLESLFGDSAANYVLVEATKAPSNCTEPREECSDRLELSAEDEEQFYRVFRISRCTGDLVSALRVVANSNGKYNLKWWQAYYQTNAAEIEARLAPAKKSHGSKITPHGRRNSKRKRLQSPSSSEDDESDSSTSTQAQLKRKVYISRKKRKEAAQDGKKTPFDSHSLALLKKVDEGHLKRVKQLISRFNTRDRRYTVTNFLKQLPEVSKPPQWSTVYWTYRELFQCVEGLESPESLERQPSKSEGPSPTRASSSVKLSKATRRVPDGKSYFTRSNLNVSGPSKPVKRARSASSEIEVIEKRQKWGSEPRALSKREAADFEQYALRYAHRDAQKIAQGYAEQSTASLRDADTYFAWGKREGLFGFDPSQTKASQWRGNAECGGCKGKSADLVSERSRQLCVDCRIDWARGGSKTQQKGELKSRRHEVLAWKRKLGLESE